MKNVGGFFELELPHGGSLPHPKAIALSTGRACLSVILHTLRPRLVHLPFYTCDALLEPFERHGVSWCFYAIDSDFAPCDTPVLGEGEYFLWIDYFGIHSATTEALKSKYGDKLLIDDTHAFFAGAHTGNWSFTSARKYFGVPDGAFLHAPVALNLAAERFESVSLDHGLWRHLGRQEDAYAAFQSHEQSIDCAIYRISVVSEGLLRGVDLGRVAAARRANFAALHDRLSSSNEIAVGLAANEVPFCYPYLPSSPRDRAMLHRAGLFVPAFWEDTLARSPSGFEWERRLSTELLPLPVDHRYGTEEMKWMVDLLEGAYGPETDGSVSGSSGARTARGSPPRHKCFGP